MPAIQDERGWARNDAIEPLPDNQISVHEDCCPPIQYLFAFIGHGGCVLQNLSGYSLKTCSSESAEGHNLDTHGRSIPQLERACWVWSVSTGYLQREPAILGRRRAQVGRRCKVAQDNLQAKQQSSCASLCTILRRSQHRHGPECVRSSLGFAGCAIEPQAMVHGRKFIIPKPSHVPDRGQEIVPADGE